MLAGKASRATSASPDTGQRGGVLRRRLTVQRKTAGNRSSASVWYFRHDSFRFALRAAGRRAPGRIAIATPATRRRLPLPRARFPLFFLAPFRHLPRQRIPRMKIEDILAALPEQEVTIDVLREKYAKGDESSAYDVRGRAARALASVEPPALRAPREAVSL